MQELFERLRAANTARQEEWPGNEKCDVLFRAIEVGGEIGELLMATNGFYEHENFKDELGDVIISLDLLKNELGAPALGAVRLDPAKGGLAERGFMMLEAVKKFHRSEVGIVGGHADDPLALVLNRIGHVVHACQLIAGLYQVDLEKAVRSKFNKTSVKHGFQTFL